MFQWDAWYSRTSRLTFDGAGRAGTALLYGPAFSTYNETSDLVFRDATNGLFFGGPETAGQAENAVLRCQFRRCQTGLQTVNRNSMDIWVWYGRFEDCGRGVHNVMGNWHVWESLFLRWRVADVSSMNLMAFSVVNNTSIGSRCFFDFGTGHTWGSPVSLTGNRVLDPTGEWAVLLDNAGPYLVVDNQFRIEQRTTADDVWRNLTQPPARGGLIGCNVNTGNRDAAAKGFEFLANIGEQSDPAKSASGAGPLDDRGTVDDATLLRHLAPLRAARVWLPDEPLPSNTTDLALHRVMASGGHGAVVEFRGRPAH